MWPSLEQCPSGPARGSHIPLETFLPLIPGPTRSKGGVPDGLS